MEDLWLKSHKFILDCVVGDFYYGGGNKVSVVKRTSRRIYFDNGNVITIKKSESGKFFYFSGKSVDQILRDIEGYFVFLIHGSYI